MGPHHPVIRAATAEPEGAREADRLEGMGKGELEAAALNSIGSAVMVTEADGTIVWVNRAFSQMSGYSAEEAVGQTPRLLRSGVHGPDHYQRLWSTILDHRIWRGEVVERRRDGVLYTVMQTITPMSDERGATTHFVAVHEDVTQLRSSQARLQALFDHAVDGIILFDDDGRIVDANRAVCAWTGYATEELAAMTMAHLVPTAYRDRYEQGWASFRTDQQGRGSLPIRQRDGGVVHVEYQSVAGIAPGLNLVIARDVTDQRRVETRQRFQSQLLEAVGDAVVATDLDGIVRYANPAAERLYGWSEEQMLGTAVTELMMPDFSAEQAQKLLAEVRAGRTWSGQAQMRRRDGASFTARSTNAPYLDASGQLAGIISVATDITDLERTRRLLVRRARQQSVVAEVSHAAMRSADAEQVAARARGLVAELLGSDISIERVADAGPGAPAPRPGVRVDLDGAECLLVSGGAAAGLDAEDHQFLRSLAHVVDAARERHAAASHSEHLATHDPLTGLPNRTLFLDRLEQVRAACQRSGERFAVLFFDLDGLKSVNDGLGHHTGDEVLRAVAVRLRGEVRPGDTVARFGGDEFALLCSSVADAGAATIVADRIRSALASGLPTHQGTVMVTASIGIAIGAADTEGPELLRDVDTAMYAAKAAGRNRTEVFDDHMQDQARRRYHMAAALQTALEGNGVEVHYQPTVELATGRIVGVEALARLRAGDGTLIPPIEFVGVAEQTGLIDALGAAVLRRACLDAGPWIAADPAFMLSVNLSPRQLNHGDLAETIESILEGTGVDPTSLVLEITESTLLSGPVVAGTMHRLRQQGIRFAIDDFGTGYSSLAHLRHMPVDLVKIDRSFVSGLTTDIQDRALVAATIDLAHTFALAATAEGVETPAQLAELTVLGCDYAQGYLWSPPVEAREFAAMLLIPPLPARKARGPKTPVIPLASPGRQAHRA